MPRSASRMPRRHATAQDRFLALAHERADVFWLLTPDGRMQEGSPSWDHFTGQQQRQSLGQGWLNAMYPPDQSSLKALLHQAVRFGQPAEGEYHLRHADGAFCLIHVRAIPVRLPDGTIGEVIMYGTDLTKQELAAPMSDVHIQHAIQVSGVGFWEKNILTDQVLWTKQMHLLLGYGLETPASEPHFLAVVHPDDRKRIEQDIARALDEHTTYHSEYRVIWPDGSVHWMTTRGQTLFDPQGQPAQMLGAILDVTPLKEVEEHLQVANAQIRTILESISDAFMYLDAHWRYLYVNQRMGEILGRNPVELPGRVLWDVVPELHGTPFEQHYREAMERQQAVHFEECHPTFQRWLDVHVYPSKEGLSVYLHDISERKRLEHERAQQMEQLRLQTRLIGLAHDAILVCDPRHRIISWNQGAQTLYGWTSQEALGQVSHTLLQTSFPQPLAMITQQLEQEGQWEGELVHTCRDGRQIRVESRWALICDERERPSAILEINRDVTERKRVEEALRESETRFRGLVESNLIGIMVSDLGGSIHEANDAFLSLVGYTQEEVVKGVVNWTTMTPPEYQERDRQAIEELHATGMFHPFEKEYVTKAGKRTPILLGGTLFHPESASPLVLCFIVDLTAQKEMDRQKDLMLSMTSHELKTPLCALKGTLQVVQRRAKRLSTTAERLLPEVNAFFDDLSERLATCARNVDVQTHLVNDLLDVSRIAARTLKLELDRQDLVTIVRETVEDLRVVAPERALLLALPKYRTVPVLVDADRISQVVINYVTNALRYSSADQPIRIGLSIQKQVARVWVRDQGPGLSETAQKDLWQRFHQVSGVPVQGDLGKGLGLGLYICQTLIAQHQGEVGVESAPGKGSTFWFTLPIAT